MRGLLITGEPFEFGGASLDSAGYDLLALITGSEGLLAVITEVTVKLTPKPQLAQVACAAFDDVEKAGAAVGAIIGEGIIPAGLEMMDQPATRAVEELVRAGYDLEAAAILLCEADGTPEEVEDEIARVREVLARAGATRTSVSRDEAERLRFWSGRKAAFPAVGRISPDYYCMDGTIPRMLSLVVLTFFTSTSYLGLGVETIRNPVEGTAVPWYASILKMVSTSVTLSFDGSGGIITPIFFVGSTAGNLLGNLPGFDMSVFSAIGMVSLLPGLQILPFRQVSWQWNFSAQRLRLTLLYLALSVF